MVARYSLFLGDKIHSQKVAFPLYSGTRCSILVNDRFSAGRVNSKTPSKSEICSQILKDWGRGAWQCCSGCVPTRQRFFLSRRKLGYQRWLWILKGAANGSRRGGDDSTGCDRKTRCRNPLKRLTAGKTPKTHKKNEKMKEKNGEERIKWRKIEHTWNKQSFDMKRKFWGLDLLHCNFLR